MTTLNEIIAIIEAENPTIQIGDDEQGYTQLNSEDYKAQVKQWAEARLNKEARQIEAQAAKAAAQQKLTALGLTIDDLKALGL